MGANNNAARNMLPFSPSTPSSSSQMMASPAKCQKVSPPSPGNICGILKKMRGIFRHSNLLGCRFFWILAFGLSVQFNSLHAATFVEMSFEKRTGRAPIIIHGQVGAGYSHWGEGVGESKRIYTTYEVGVREVLKGSLSRDTIQVRQMGGEIDGVAFHVPGTSSFEVGEEVVLLLGESLGRETYPIQTLGMGKLQVLENDNGEKVLSGMALSKKSEPKWTLDSLRQFLDERKSASAADLTDMEELEEQKVTLDRHDHDQGHLDSAPSLLIRDGVHPHAEERAGGAEVGTGQDAARQKPYNFYENLLWLLGLGTMMVIGGRLMILNRFRLPKRKK